MSQYLVKYVFCGFMKGVIPGIFLYWLFPQRGGDKNVKQVGDEPLESGGLFSGSVMLYGGLLPLTHAYPQAPVTPAP